MLSLLLILPEGKTEVERSLSWSNGRGARDLIFSSCVKGLGEALGHSEQPGSSGSKIQAGDPNEERDAWDGDRMI